MMLSLLTLGCVASLAAALSTGTEPTTPAPQLAITDPGGLTLDSYINYLLRRDCDKVSCTGRDCKLSTDKRGCPICACPIGTPARGCDRMPRGLVVDLVINGCPNVNAGVITRSPVKRAQRWYRAIDAKGKFDECRKYDYPLCPDLEYSLWRSPQTKDECLYFCYADSGAPRPPGFDSEEEGPRHGRKGGRRKGGRKNTPPPNEDSEAPPEEGGEEEAAEEEKPKRNRKNKHKEEDAGEDATEVEAGAGANAEPLNDDVDDPEEAGLQPVKKNKNKKGGKKHKMVDEDEEEGDAPKGSSKKAIAADSTTAAPAATTVAAAAAAPAAPAVAETTTVAAVTNAPSPAPVPDTSGKEDPSQTKPLSPLTQQLIAQGLAKSGGHAGAGRRKGGRGKSRTTPPPDSEEAEEEEDKKQH